MCDTGVMKHATPRSSLTMAKAITSEYLVAGELSGLWFRESGMLYIVDSEAYDRAVDSGETYAPVLRFYVKVPDRWAAWDAVESYL